MQSCLRHLILGLALALGAAVAMASTGAPPDEVPLLPSEFAERADAIREGMKPGGEYHFVKPRDAERVDEALSRMQAVLDRGKPLDRLSSGEMLKLYNAQERVNSILEQRPMLGILCERKRPLGSNLIKTECKTYRQWRAQQEQMDENDKMMLQQCRGADCQAPG